MSSNGGYGICGAFNVYSSTAKLGNWVEDKAGQELSSHPRPAVGMYVTNTQAHHIAPNDMVANPKLTQVKMMSTAELKAKNKEGTSYSLLFNHGKAMNIDERYRTANQERFKLKDYEERFARPANSLALERAKESVREIRSQFNQVRVVWGCGCGCGCVLCAVCRLCPNPNPNPPSFSPLPSPSHTHAHQHSNLAPVWLLLTRR